MSWDTSLRRSIAEMSIVLTATTFAACARHVPALQAPTVAIPSGMGQLGAPCSAAAMSGERTTSRCGRDGRAALLVLVNDDRVLGSRRSRCGQPYCVEDDPLVVERPASIAYPPTVLENACWSGDERQTVYLDGSNLWIRFVWLGNWSRLARPGPPSVSDKMRERWGRDPSEHRRRDCCRRRRRALLR